MKKVNGRVIQLVIISIIVLYVVSLLASTKEPITGPIRVTMIIFVMLLCIYALILLIFIKTSKKYNSIQEKQIVPDTNLNVTETTEQISEEGSEEAVEKEEINKEERKKEVLKEAEEILNNRRAEFGSEIKPLAQKYTGNIDKDIYNFYGRYIEILDKYLKRKHIKCNMPIFESVTCDATDVIDQKENSINSIYKIKCRGMEFAFIENGNRLWRMGPPNVMYRSWNERLKEVSKTKVWFDHSCDIFAALATDSEIYILFQSGLVRSTDPNFEEANIFKKIDEARRICAKLPVQAVLDTAGTIQKLIDDDSHRWKSEAYYSWESKLFVSYHEDGSYDTGVYGVYASESKEYFLENYLVDINLYDMWIDVKNEIVPRFAALDCLPEDPTANCRYTVQIY